MSDTSQAATQRLFARSVREAAAAVAPNDAHALEVGFFFFFSFFLNERKKRIMWF